MHGRDRVDDPVRADLLRVVVFDDEAGLCRFQDQKYTPDQGKRKFDPANISICLSRNWEEEGFSSAG